MQQISEKTYSLARRYFPDLTQEAAIPNKEAFIKHLTPVLQYFLDRKFEQLLQIMYRIDVSERDFTLTLTAGEPTTVAPRLAELIYDRLLLKVKMRARYS